MAEVSPPPNRRRGDIRTEPPLTGRESMLLITDRESGRVSLGARFPEETSQEPGFCASRL